MLILNIPESEPNSVDERNAFEKLCELIISKLPLKKASGGMASFIAMFIIMTFFILTIGIFKSEMLNSPLVFVLIVGGFISICFFKWVEK